MNPQGSQIDNTITMIEHEAFDGAFNRLYQEGMTLIEQTAAYIDGDGKTASRQLSGEASSLYAGEAMRMSTRLMQVASWLLLFRAAREKEMTEEQIRQEKAKVSLNTPSVGQEDKYWRELPEDFRYLVGLSLRLEERVRHMDQEVDNTVLDHYETSNPVSQQISLLRSAFHRD